MIAPLLNLLLALAPLDPAQSSTIGAAPTMTSSGARYHPDDPRADTFGTPPLPPRERALSPPSAPVGEPRPLPSYDGRPPEPLDAGDVLIWVPRVVFLPARLVLEYGLRWPMVKLITWTEKEKIVNRVASVFTFREGNSVLFPTAFLDFGLSPSVGFYTAHEQLFHPAHSLALQGGFWGDEWIRLALADRWTVFHGSGQLQLKAEYLTRPDHPFYGVGYASAQDDRIDLRWRRFDAGLALASTLSGLNRVGLELRLRRSEIGENLFLSGPPGDGLRCTGAAPRPACFGAYTLLSAEASGTIDTREVEREFTGGTGVRFDLRAGYHLDPTANDVGFFRFTGVAAGFLDLSGANHVLGLQVYADALARTHGEALPVSELISTGGAEHMRGFLAGRLRGDSAFEVSVDYRYPIWILMDADLFVGVGNAFGEGFEGFAWDRLALNAGLGLRAGLSRESSLDFIIAVGTNRFEEGDLRVDNVRLTLGANHGF